MLSIPLRSITALIAPLSLLALLACGGDPTTSSSQTSGSSSSGSSSGGGGGSAPAVDRGPTSIPIDGDANGLFWEAATSTLYIADDNGNRILQWTDQDGLSLAATLPDAPLGSAGLGQPVKMPDGTIVIPRFGGGTAGDVVFVDPNGNGGKVPNLDVVRRRIGLTITEDGTLYDSYFTSINGVKIGSVARLDLSGSEVEVITGLEKPVGVLAMGADLFVSDQLASKIFKAPLASLDKLAALTTIPAPDLLCDGPNGAMFTGSKTGSVRQIAADGTFDIVASGFQEVRGVAYDPANKRLFLADHDPQGVANLLRIVPVD